MLKINHLSKQFAGNEFYSLKDVSLEINKGEIVGLIGKNGAGKSTLMKLMAKSLKPSSGTITYKGTDIFSQDNLLADFEIGRIMGSSQSETQGILVRYETTDSFGDYLGCGVRFPYLR